MQALLHGMVGVGILGLLAKLHKWDDSAMFFDGSSLCAYVFGVAVYGTVIIPSLRTIVVPAASDTVGDRIEAMRVLSAANVIIGVCLFGVLFLQVSERERKKGRIPGSLSFSRAGRSTHDGLMRRRTKKRRMSRIV